MSGGTAADDPEQYPSFGFVTPQNMGLLTDLYELVMADSYLRHGMNEPATFDQKRAIGREPPDEQVERGRLVHAVAQVAVGHDQFVQIRQEPHVLGRNESEGGILLSHRVTTR